MVAAILGNPVMIEAYKQGIPANGKPFPDGAKMPKIHWISKPSEKARRRRRCRARCMMSISW